MKNVPCVTKVGTVPCVWDINSFITPFIRTVHDFGNVHHFWLHKSVEGTRNLLHIVLVTNKDGASFCYCTWVHSAHLGIFRFL